jgi:pimeloyl-ACP methyl ester carboxylesterase
MANLFGFNRKENDNRTIWNHMDRLKTDDIFRELNFLTKKFFKTFGLNDKIDYRLFNVQLKTLPGHIRTLEAGWHNPETIVLVHGYGSSIPFFGPVLQDLIKNYHVYAFDLYGMGGSYRCDSNFKSFDHAMGTYTKSIEEWRAELNLENFHVIAHSIGKQFFDSQKDWT